MTENEFEELTNEYDFKQYADIVASNSGCAQFINFDPSSGGVGHVYLWVEKSNIGLEIVYVGKAGGTMRDRCNQHFSGFKGGSKVGRRHSHNILDGISKERSYRVYSRKSKTCDLLGEKDISMSCIEEIAFIKKFSPPWNSI